MISAGIHSVYPPEVLPTTSDTYPAVMGQMVRDLSVNNQISGVQGLPANTVAVGGISGAPVSGGNRSSTSSNPPQQSHLNSLFNNIHVPQVQMSVQPSVDSRQTIIGAVPGSEFYVQSPPTSVPDFNNRAGSIGSPSSDRGSPHVQSYGGILNANGTFHGNHHHPGYAAGGDGNIYGAPSNRQPRQPQTGTSKPLHGHKAAEQRSRNKLKNCVHELLISVPSLQGVKNPTKATILKKSAEYVNYAKKTNKDLKDENQKLKNDCESLKSEKDQLREEKRELDSQLKTASLVTVEIMDPEFNYVFVDSMWEIMMGFEKDEIIGRSSHNVTACTTCPVMLRHQETVVEDLLKGTEWQGVVLGARKDGKLFACEAVTSPVTNKAGVITQFITKRKNFHLLTPPQAEKVCKTKDIKSLDNSEFLSKLKISSLVETEI
eukprot:Nk52_evm66s158 gene=Nk52_evmTU66s158